MASPSIKRVLGVDAILNDFKQLEKHMIKKCAKPAANEALKVLQKKAKKNCKWRSIRKLISRKALITRTRDIFAKVFVKKDKSGRQINLEDRMVGFEVAANILEFGRAAPGDAGGSKVVKPDAFMRRAREAEGKLAMTVFRNEVERNFKRYFQ